MSAPINVALITACATALGWLVNNVLTQQREERKSRTEATLRHLERQLEELYGPLVALMYEGRQIFEELLRSLGRNYVFREGEELPEDELRTWLYWTEHSFLPRNRQIRDLLISKSHLVEGETFPESYVTFFLHESSWAVQHDRWQKEQVRYSWHSSINWPAQFEHDVIATFKALKARHSILLGTMQSRGSERAGWR